MAKKFRTGAGKPRGFRVSRDTVYYPSRLRDACIARMAELGVDRTWVVARAVEAGAARPSVYRFFASATESRYPVAMTVAEVLGLAIVPLPEVNARSVRR